MGLLRNEMRPPLMGLDGAIRKHEGTRFALQNLRPNASKQKFGGVLRVGNLTQPFQKIPGDFKRVFDKSW